MSKRHSDALSISDGACNPSGIARSLVEACDEARSEGTPPSEDHAVKLIISQLAYLVGVWDGASDFCFEPSFAECRETCRACKAIDEAPLTQNAPREALS